MSQLLKHLGKYFIMMKRVINKPKKWYVFWNQILLELEKIGLNSVGLVVIISFFVGGFFAFVLSIKTENMPWLYFMYKK